MLIPYNTDASIYYWPFATCGLIAINVAAFVGMVLMHEALPETEYLRIYNELSLRYGEGLRPLQWITSNFLHAGPLHLLGNMFCLWGFGLVVEGKVGWWKFLAIYFGIGATQCAFEQSVMLFAPGGGSLGASSIIYGLLAIAMIWAPMNEMSCVFLIIIRPIMFEVTLYTLAIVAVLIELGTSLLSGMALSSSILHLMGAFLGFGVGTAMLKWGWVDCEGWDVFSVWSGRPDDDRKEEKEAAERLLQDAERTRHERRLNEVSTEPFAVDSDESLPLTSVDDGSASLDDIRRALAAGDAQAAFEAYQAYSFGRSGHELPERELLQIIAQFQKSKRWAASLPPMVEYLGSFSEREAPIRLRVARVLIDVERRPRQALYVLEKLNPALLSDKDRSTLEKLRAKAERLKQSVDNEALPEEW